MIRKIFLLILVAFAGTVLAEDIPTKAIPCAQIKKCLPDKWAIESVRTANSVLGWTRLNGSRGIRVTFSRLPYDDKQQPIKSETFAPSSSRFYLDIFPLDFEGKNINTSAIFRQGKVTESISNQILSGTVPEMTEYRQIEDWYVFYNTVGFPDWESPVDEILKEITRIKHIKPLPDMKTATVATEEDAVNVVLKIIAINSNEKLAKTCKTSAKMAFILGWDIPDLGKKGDRMWQVDLTEPSGQTKRVAWVNAENKDIMFLFAQEESFLKP